MEPIKQAKDLYGKYVGGNHQEMVRKCEYCLKEGGVEEEHCTNCGGNIKVLEPWVLQCGWCSTSNRRDETLDCIKCGGELPNIPGSGPAPKPSPAPRKLTGAYVTSALLSRNSKFILGVGLIIVLGWTVIVGIIGILLVISGWKAAYAKTIALRNGIPTRGEITEITIDHKEIINGDSPLLIKFDFDTEQGVKQGWTKTWDLTNQKRVVGEHVWVVYNPKNHEQNNIWPPIQYGKHSKTELKDQILDTIVDVNDTLEESNFS